MKGFACPIGNPKLETVKAINVPKAIHCRFKEKIIFLILTHALSNLGLDTQDAGEIKTFYHLFRKVNFNRVKQGSQDKE